MPYPSQIDADLIVATARAMIEAEGVDGLSLGRLAKELGVKAPSLYRYFENKAALLRAINMDTNQRLFAAFDKALAGAPASVTARLSAVSRAYRAFAHESPQTYMLAMTNADDDLRPDENALVQMVEPVQAMMAEIVGEALSLSALRGLLALVHGFVMLELNEQLRRGGDLDAAFEYSLSAYLRGWAQDKRR